MRRRPSASLRAEPAAGSDAANWPDLFTLAASGASEGEILSRVLESWCSNAGSSGAALYLTENGALRRRHAVGERAFPAVLVEVPEDCDALEIGEGGKLVFCAVEDGSTGATGPLDAVVALLLRMLSLQGMVKRERFEASYRGVEQQALYDVGLSITATLNLEDLSDLVLTWAMGLIDARRAALFLVDGDALRLKGVLGGDACEVCALEEDGISPPDDILPGATFLESLPIEREGELLGLLVVADKESRTGVGPFGDGDQRTLRLFANQAAIALENARLHRQALEAERLARELELAADIQRRILPKHVPSVDGYDVVGWNRPARQVGGDYYDLRLLDDRELLLVLGDVSGKGMPAALLVSTLHSSLRMTVERNEFASPVLESVNRHIHESSASNKFITLIIALLDPETGDLRYINAGHNSCVVIGTDGSVREMVSSGLPIGLMPVASYQVGSVELSPGDLVCLYSDGITECANREDEEYELERLTELLLEHRHDPLEDLLALIDRTMIDFAEGLPQGDDQTVVLLRRN